MLRGKSWEVQLCCCYRWGSNVDVTEKLVRCRQFSLPEQSGPARFLATLRLGGEASPVLCVSAVVPAGGGIGGHFLGSFGNLLMPELGTGTDDELRGGRGGGGGSAAGSLQLHGTSPSEWVGSEGRLAEGGRRAAGCSACQSCATATSSLLQDDVGFMAHQSMWLQTAFVKPAASIGHVAPMPCQARPGSIRI